MASSGKGAGSYWCNSTAACYLSTTAGWCLLSSARLPEHPPPWWHAWLSWDMSARLAALWVSSGIGNR